MAKLHLKPPGRNMRKLTSSKLLHHQHLIHQSFCPTNLYHMKLHVIFEFK